MNYGYIRVSSDKQTVENQKYEINGFCEVNGIKIDGWISETISGNCAYDKRRLGKLLHRVGKGDCIICSEISRLGRNLYMIMEILNICMTKECKVWTIKDGFRLGDDIQSKVLAFAFGLSAEIERKLISQRTKDALARRKAEGMKLGRPVGARTSFTSHKLYSVRDKVFKMYLDGCCTNKIAKTFNVSFQTVKMFLINNGYTNTPPPTCK